MRLSTASMRLGDFGDQSTEVARRRRLEWYLNDMNAIIKQRVRGVTTILFEDPEQSESKGMLVRLVNSTCFQMLRILTCVVSSGLVALQLDMPQHSETWYALELWCLLIFSLELLLNLCASRRRFFTDPWNIFDIVLLLFNVIDLLELVEIQNTALLRFLRGMKVVRALRFWKFLPEIRRVTSAVTKSMSSMTWGFAFFIIILYMGAILSTVALRDTEGIYPGFAPQEEEWDSIEEFNPVMYFGSVVSSMYTLFNLAIQTEFAEFARAIWIKQPLLFLCLAIFACCICFGMQNFVITACVENAADVDRKMNEETNNFVESQKLETLKELMIVLFGEDKSRKVLTQDQLKKALDKQDMCHKLAMLEFPVSLSSAELFLLLDDTGTGKIPYADFMRNAVHLIASSTKPFEGQCLLQLTMNKIMARLHCLESERGLGNSSQGQAPGGGGSTSLTAVDSVLVGSDMSRSMRCFGEDSQDWSQQCRSRAQRHAASSGGSGSACSSVELQEALARGDSEKVPGISEAMNLFEWQLRSSMQRATEEILALANSTGLRQCADVSTFSVDEIVKQENCEPPLATVKSSVEQLPVLLGTAPQLMNTEHCTQQMPPMMTSVKKCADEHSGFCPKPQDAATVQSFLDEKEEVITCIRSPRVAVHLPETDGNQLASKAPRGRFEDTDAAGTAPMIVHPGSACNRMTRPSHIKFRAKSPKGGIGTGVGLWFSSMSSAGKARGQGATSEVPSAASCPVANKEASHTAVQL